MGIDFDGYTRLIEGIPLCESSTMADIAVGVGEAIRDRRQGVGLSQEALAAISGINRSYLGQVERGEVSITVSLLAKISRGLNVSLSDLLRGVDEFRPDE